MSVSSRTSQRVPTPTLANYRSKTPEEESGAHRGMWHSLSSSYRNPPTRRTTVASVTGRAAAGPGRVLDAARAALTDGQRSSG